MEKYLYTTEFLNPIVSCHSEQRNFAAEASFGSLKDLIPANVDLSANVDLLAVAFDCAVANQFNKKDDGIFGYQAVEIYKNFIHKPTNLEHEKTKIVGHITTAGLVRSDKDEEISEEEAAASLTPFKISLGAFVYKYCNPDYAELIERSTKESDPLFQKISTSWEVGFSSFYIAAGEGEMADCELITDEKTIKSLKKYLVAYGGNGRTPEGVRVRRILAGELYPLGIGFTTSPAAHVKGVISAEADASEMDEDTEDDDEESDDNNYIAESSLKVKDLYSFLRKNNSQISQSSFNNVKNTKETIMDLDKMLSELKTLLVEKKFSEEAVANMTKTFDEAIKKKDEEYKAELKKKEDEAIALANEREEVKNALKDLQTKFEESSLKLQEIENEKIQEQAVARFNARMDEIDSIFDLDDEDRKVLADDLKSITDDEAFASYKSKLSIMWRGKDKEAKASLEKEIQEKINEEVLKRTKGEVSTASVAQTPEEIAKAALENAEAPNKETIPNSSEAGSQAEPTLREKFAGAFSRENVIIS